MRCHRSCRELREEFPVEELLPLFYWFGRLGLIGRKDILGFYFRGSPLPSLRAWSETGTVTKRFMTNSTVCS